MPFVVWQSSHCKGESWLFYFNCILVATRMSVFCVFSSLCPVFLLSLIVAFDVHTY